MASLYSTKVMASGGRSTPIGRPIKKSRWANPSGLDLLGLDIVSVAKGYGCDAARLEDIDLIRKAARGLDQVQTYRVRDPNFTRRSTPYLLRQRMYFAA